MSDNNSNDANAISAKQVEQFLTANPNFLIETPHLLEQLNLSHSAEGSTSLVERKMQILHERNIESRKRLDNLIATARDNDRLFEKTQRLVLALLGANDFPSMVDALYNSLGSDYGVEFYSLILLSNNGNTYPTSKATINTFENANSHISNLLHSRKAVCGIVRPEEMAFLFGKASDNIGSIAAVPLHNMNTFGLLAIGNSDPQFYRSSMGTLFLSYLGEVLSRLIPRYQISS